MSTEYQNTEMEAVTPMADTHESEVSDVETEAPEGEGAEPKGDETKEEVWPKKAQNALSRAKKDLNKTRAELRAMQQQVQQFQAMMQQQQHQKVDNAPKEADFETVLDYLKAESAFEARKAAEEYYLKQSKQASEQTSQQMFIEQRGEHIAAKEEELVKVIPDLREVIEDSEELHYLPPQIKELFITADNPSLAAYNLIKEGKIGALAYMHPQLAAAEIVRAQSNMPQVRKPSSAPQPMRGLNGGGTGAKATTEMSPSELMKWVNQK